MWYVYVLKSKDSDWYRVGSTEQFMKNIEQHNQGLSQSTKHYAPF
ncbi:MAG: GIY-YIG nuclease family protein [Candidatus Halalkalibacterium sp. M3_1C_030]